MMIVMLDTPAGKLCICQVAFFFLWVDFLGSSFSFISNTAIVFLFQQSYFKFLSVTPCLLRVLILAPSTALPNCLQSPVLEASGQISSKTGTHTRTNEWTPVKSEQAEGSWRAGFPVGVATPWGRRGFYGGPGWGYWGVVLYYFLQLHVNLQLPQC